MTAREIARSQLAEVGLPPLVLEIFDGTARLPDLQYRCQDPHRVFSTSSQALRDLVPMWECGVVVTGLDQGHGGFVKLSLEEPDEPWARFAKFSQVLADLFIDLWEDEADDETLRELADGFEFEGLERLLETLNKGQAANHQHYQEWRRALVASF